VSYDMSRFNVKSDIYSEFNLMYHSIPETEKLMKNLKKKTKQISSVAQ